MRFVLSLLLVFLCASRASAFFRLGCGASITIQRVDPIVSPGFLGTHIHMVSGGSKFNSTTNSAALRQSKCTTCTVAEDNSAYWIPDLYFLHPNGSFEQVDQGGNNDGGLLIYYQQRPNSYNDTTVYGIPQGLRIVSGTPTLKTFDVTSQAQQAVTVACVDYNYNGHPQTNALPMWDCPQGLRAQVWFPSCWDGVNLDSADHKSHMAFPDGISQGQCPPSHPKRIISLFYEKYYSTTRFAPQWLDANGYPTRHQPYYWSTGDNTGFSLHGDFMDGWNTTTIDLATQYCTDTSGVIENCQYFTFVSGGAQSSCQPEYAPLSNEITTGWLPGDLPGMAGHIPVPAFNPCAPSPNAPWDASSMQTAMNPRLCFTTDASTNYQPPAIGSTALSGCNSYTCLFIDTGADSTSSVTTNLIGGAVTWVGDKVYQGSLATVGSFTAMNYGTSTVGNNIVNLADKNLQTLYSTMSYSNDIMYNFSMPAGNYNLRMGFVENYFSAAGQRVFSVLMNGNVILSNFDIFATAGAKNTAVNISVPITVTANSIGQAAISDYSVGLTFHATVNAPQISFIAITPPAMDAYIFEGIVPSATATTASPSGSVTTVAGSNGIGSPVNNGGSSSNIGAIVGGIVGGVAAIAIIAGAVYYWKKQKKATVQTNNYMRDESRGSSTYNKKASTIASVSNTGVVV